MDGGAEAPLAPVPGPRDAPSEEARYRDEYTAGKFSNMMFDRRVVRGVTTRSGQGREEEEFGGVGPEQQTRSGRARGGERKGQSLTGSTFGATSRLEDRLSIYEVRPPARKYQPVPLEAHLVEQEEAKTAAEVQTQTDVFAERPPTPDYVPRKTGIDAATQIEEADGLFDFDREAAPIVNVVVGKTLEQALMEVVEEDELRGIRQAKDEFHRKKQDEGRRVTELERREAARLAEKNKAVKAAQLRARRERDVRRKVASMHCARHLLGGLVHDAMAALEARGLFPDPLATEIEREFWPQVLEGAARHTNARANAQHAVDDILRHALDRRTKAAQAAGEARRPKKGWVRLHLPTAEGAHATRVVGPIEVKHKDTVGDVEERMRQWLADHPGEVEVPEGRVLQLQQDGKALPATAALLDLPQGRETPLEVSFVAKGGEEGKEEPADGEGDE